MKLKTAYGTPLLASVLLAALTPPGWAQEPEPQAPPIQATDLYVHKVTPLLEGGQNVDWSAFLNRILVDSRGSGRYYHVYSLRPDGQRLKNVTQAKQRERTAHHNGSASWLPGGDYFVFTSQNPGDSSYTSAMPATGLNCNIWLGDREGTQFWQLTDLKTRYRNPSGVVAPHFSPDGKTLFWSGNTGQYPSGSIWGEHALYLADFEMKDSQPALSNIRTFQPGQQFDFYQSHGFTPDGNKIIFSANLNPGQPLTGMDIFTIDRTTGRLDNLTDSPDVWDQYAACSPDGTKIVWASTAGQAIPYLPMNDQAWQRYLRSEIWIMSADGKRRKQLTFFNTPAGTHPESVGKRCYVGNMAWSPDGKQLAVCLNKEAAYFSIEPEVVILDLGSGSPAEVRAPAPSTETVPAKPPVAVPAPVKKPFTW